MRTPTLLALSLSLLLPSSARAQLAEPQRNAAAEALYEQAITELDAKSYASACQKLEQVTQMVPEALGAKFTLGECYEGVGKLAKAWEQYTLMEAMAQKMGQSGRAQRAAVKAMALRSLLGTLRVELQPNMATIAGLVIERDGVAVEKAQWGSPIAVDAGKHEIVATAPGRKAWKKQVDVKADGMAVTVAVELPALEVVAANRPMLRASPISAASVSTDQLLREDSPTPTGRAASTNLLASADRSAPSTSLEAWRQRSLELTLMGLGALGVTISAMLGSTAIAKIAVDDSESATRLGAASIMTLLGSGMSLGLGIARWRTADPAAKSQQRGSAGKSVQAQLELVPGGLGVRGTW
jgi:hypothetical protein